MNVTAGAWPGDTEPKLVGPVGLAVQPSGSCSARRTAFSVALPPAVSVTRTAAAWPGCMVEGALTVTWREPAVVPMVNEPCNGSPASAEESPTYTPYVPAVCVQPLAVSSHQDMACGVTVNETRVDFPGARFTRWNPASCRGGSPDADGSDRYNWATSDPVRFPVLV